MTTQCGPHRLTYSVRDQFIGSDLFLTGSWEPHLTRLLPHLGLDGQRAIDVGANIGTYTVRLSDAVGPLGEVIAIEPDERNAAWLQQNLSQNGCTNAVVRRVAVGSRSDEVAFARDPRNLGNHRVVAEGSNQDGRVPMVTLDSISAGLPDDSVGYLKIDVQGFELEVLRGAERTLERHPSAVLQLELNADEAGRAVEVVDLLRALGWDGFEIHHGRVVPMLAAGCYAWPWFRSECDLLLSRDRAHLASTLGAALR